MSPGSSSSGIAIRIRTAGAPMIIASSANAPFSAPVASVAFSCRTSHVQAPLASTW